MNIWKISKVLVLETWMSTFRNGRSRIRLSGPTNGRCCHVEVHIKSSQPPLPPLSQFSFSWGGWLKVEYSGERRTMKLKHVSLLKLSFLLLHKMTISVSLQRCSSWNTRVTTWIRLGLHHYCKLCSPKSSYFDSLHACWFNTRCPYFRLICL